jgi:acetyltransferase
MSWATRYLRGARSVENLKAEDINRAVNLDAASEVAFVAIAGGATTGPMAGIVRATRCSPDCWEFTLVVVDAYQRGGVGRRLMSALLDELRARDATLLVGEVLASNLGMLDFVGTLGFVIHEKEADEVTRRISLALRPDAP